MSFEWSAVGEPPALNVDGESVVLTDDVINELLKIVNQKSVNPFARSQYGEKYYYISSCTNSVGEANETGHPVDTEVYKSTNYFQDKSIANQVVLHQWLYRKLLKFTYDNDCVDTVKWDDRGNHWFIYYDRDARKFEAAATTTVQQPLTVYFSTIYAACSAIKKVVEPFMKEHPEFVW